MCGRSMGVKLSYVLMKFQRSDVFWFGDGLDGHSLKIPQFFGWTSLLRRDQVCTRLRSGLV